MVPTFVDHWPAPSAGSTGAGVAWDLARAAGAGRGWRTQQGRRPAPVLNAVVRGGRLPPMRCVALAAGVPRLSMSGRVSQYSGRGGGHIPAVARRIAGGNQERPVDGCPTRCASTCLRQRAGSGAAVGPAACWFSAKETNTVGDIG